MAASDEIKGLKDQVTAAKAEMEKLLGSTQGLERAAIRATQPYKDQVTILKEANAQIKERLAIQKQSIDSLIQQESKLKGLTGLQASLVSQDRKRIELQDSIDGSYTDTHEALNSIASLNQELLSMSAEDFIGRQRISELISDQIEQLDGVDGITDEIVKNLQSQFKTAKSVSSMTEKQQKFLNNQLAVYEGIQDTIGGVLETAQLLVSTTGGRLGAALMGAGYALDKIGQTTREFGGTMGGAVVSTTALGVVFKDAVGSAKGLAAEFGGMEDVSFATQLNTNLMATNMGISGEEAAKNLSIFARLNGNSKETATNMAQSAAEMARASGLNTAQVMGDIAANSEKFAEYSNDGGKNLALAAVQAAKLGVNMGTLTNVTDSLLDFETSITKELELGAMLGRNINLNRARALAYEGKVGASVKETIKQLGGVEAFNRMDIFQKRETAKLLGISVEELSKMSANMDKLNDDGTFQKSTWGTITESLRGIVTGPLGTFVKGVGGAAIAMGQMGIDVKSLATKLPIVGKLFEKLPMRGAQTPTTAKIPKPDLTGGGKTPGGGMGAGMKGIASGLAAFANPATLLGLAAVTAAIIGIGFALRIAAPGIQAFGEAVGSIVRAVGDAVKTVIGGLGDFFMKVASVATPELALSVLGLSYGFAALTASLAAFSIVGLAAIPAMMAISAFGTATSLLGVGGETGAVEGGSLSEYEETMLSKMDSLISAVSSNKDVYLDKDKVTSLVMAKSDRSIINKLNIFNA